MKKHSSNKLLYLMIILGIIFIMAAVATLVGCSNVDSSTDRTLSVTTESITDAPTQEVTKTPTKELTAEPTDSPSPSPSPKPTEAPETKIINLLDGAKIEVPYDAEYCGSKKSEVFHYIWCDSVEDIKLDNFVIYDSVEDAVARGKRPCKRCEP